MKAAFSGVLILLAKECSKKDSHKVDMAGRQEAYPTKHFSSSPHQTESPLVPHFISKSFFRVFSPGIIKEVVRSCSM